MLLVVQGVDVRLDDTELDGVELPRYRDMMQRLARDPVGQTRVFEDVDWRTALLHCLKGCPDSPATGESSGLCARLSGEARQRPCLGMYGTKNRCCIRA